MGRLRTGWVAGGHSRLPESFDTKFGPMLYGGSALGPTLLPRAGDRLLTAKHRGMLFVACLLWGLPAVAWAQNQGRVPAVPPNADLGALREVSPPGQPPSLLAQRLRRPGPEESEEKAPAPEAPPPAEKEPAVPAAPPAGPSYSPPGFSGRGFFLLPRGTPPSADFVPIPDRWRLGLPDWRRYERNIEAPYVQGHWWDPYNQSVIKGDYPILGQHTFMNLSAISDTLFEARLIPAAVKPSAANPDSADVLGSGNQLFLNQNFIISLELFHGDTAFKPRDWEFRITPVFNVTYLDVKQTGIVNADVREGTTRLDSFISFQELFLEYHLLDISPNYDFISTRSGIQGFTSDFRGFIFNDNQLGFRLFGNLESNRNQFNVLYFRPLEKDTNSGLNRLFETRGQNLAIANFFRQDFIWPGYTTQLSVHYLQDRGPDQIDTNGFVVRPAVVGLPQQHQIDATYLGWTGDGHIGPLNLTHAFYWVLGGDSRNPIAGRRQDISAQMTALELSMDFDWIRPKVSFFWASGDKDPRDKTARGFDSIFDNPNFAGAPFSYWVRQGLPLITTNLELKGRNSLVPSLRSSKIQGQPNYVNPGLFLLNAGADIELTQKLRASVNVNFLRFHHTESLSLLLFQRDIRNDIGIDTSLGFRYRPFLNENVVIALGGAVLTAGKGLKDVYAAEQLAFTANGLETVKSSFPFGPLYSTFLSLTFAY